MAKKRIKTTKVVKACRSYPLLNVVEGQEYPYIDRCWRDGEGFYSIVVDGKAVEVPDVLFNEPRYPD